MSELYAAQFLSKIMSLVLKCEQDIYIYDEKYFLISQRNVADVK